MAFLAVTGCQKPVNAPIIYAYSDDWQPLPRTSGDGVVADTQNALIPDMPMPVGFVAVRGQSTSSVDASGTRTVRHIYQGRAAIESVMEMYRRHLPLYDWEMQNYQLAGEQLPALMQFTKGREALSIQFTRYRGVTTCVVDILPR